MVLELLSPSGLVLRSHAVACGYDDDALARLVRTGTITRIRQGAYASSQVWDQLPPRGRHLLLTEAVTQQYPADVATSHDTAILVLGGPDHGLDLSAVQLTHFDQLAARRGAGVVHHRGECRVVDVTRVNGHWCTSPARTVLDIAATHGLEVGVVVADDFIRRGLTSTEELKHLYSRASQRPGSLKARLVLDLATGKSESVGESLAWLLFRNQGLPRPEQQFEVYHPSGHVAGRTDWAWPKRRVLAEFDGLGKYVRYLREGESVADAVVREKRREDLLRELTGWTVIRLVWADLFRPEQTAYRIRAAFARTAA